MVDVVTFKVEAREKAGKGAARAVRRQGLVPGVIYGDRQAPVLVQMDPRQLVAALHKSGFYSRQYDLEMPDGTKHRALAHDVQFHVVTDAPQHIDFLRINRDTPVHADVTVEFVNQDKCPGLKQGGVLNIVRHSIPVIAKADDLPESFRVDLSNVALNASVHISDIAMPTGVRPSVTERDFTIASITAPSGLKSDVAAEAASEE
ncbi:MULTISPECIES: 50S ribosomal protein L25/general stress protein Ctc [unclassified Haematospirillum]|uniref:50S ribosomal protein L25/general stress protein Ctc n=1 Tax=unclassified Haematospirillum TaxID=2622088 RepID=UPI00143B5D32|nr:MULTISPECIES: 50S ribosomal protein L25/general stress protein Ctc [unclassified Haematospirillum]NKD55333.1 50S ribosomal protein L25/general stress protein Ctc [Haematospirillum sp. H4890]NKD75552.1 50S ribosomal protein L25/general stress protein Ctc [Haematospirillum sp. H4485]NKD88364.1 50S ribosomal protein L25/general stress protein Ctc [Haematospirillum sp. 15-248]